MSNLAIPPYQCLGIQDTIDENDMIDIVIQETNTIYKYKSNRRLETCVKWYALGFVLKLDVLQP